MFASVTVALARAIPIVRTLSPMRSFRCAKTCSILARIDDLRPLALAVRLPVGGPRLPAVDAACHAVRLEPVLVPPGAAGGIALGTAPGVGSLDQALPQPCAVMGTGVRGGPASDDPVLPVDADMGLVAEHRDGDVDLLRAARPGTSPCGT